jgi:tetratricopeptide (TPR) repeat protein
VIIALVVLAVSIGAGAYYGLHQGERDRQQSHIEEADRYYRVGLERLDAGEFELAIANFEHALELNPDHPFASQGIAEAQARIAARPTPTVETYEIVANDLYEEAVALYEAGSWEEAAAVFTQLRALDPGYEAESVEEMLFTSLYNAGMALLDEERLEEGIFYLDRAVALRPLDEDALTQRSLAVKYMTALGYWGVDWDLCIERFEQLYAIAPNYKDVFQRLYRAHVTYADAWYAQEEMCPAEEQYALALQLYVDAATEEKRANAEQICLIATPTPIAFVEGTQTITMTELPPGFATGRLAYPAYNTQAKQYDIYALFADRRLVRMATEASQPWWQWDTGALVYRDRLTPGISLLPAAGGTPQLLAFGAEVAWPSLSPDGTRLAYAAQDAGGVWQIYIRPTDGTADATLHAEGTGPVWGRNGWLAWNGCQVRGDCGIIIDDPDDDQSPTRLSGSTNDIGLSWSPDGGNLAYMANHTGNWEVYLVRTGGGFAQLTDDPASDGLPAWAPDGSGLAFVSNRDGAWGVYLMGPNGENPHKILDLGPSLPDWTSQRLSWAP